MHEVLEILIRHVRKLARLSSRLPSPSSSTTCRFGSETATPIPTAAQSPRFICKRLASLGLSAFHSRRDRSDICDHDHFRVEHRRQQLETLVTFHLIVSPVSSTATGRCQLMVDPWASIIAFEISSVFAMTQ